LLLKVLEGEDEQTISQQLVLFHQRVLPDLANNIKCGNSLIGPDFYKGQQMTFLNEEEMYRINAFDWEKEFSEIINPPIPPLGKGNPPLPPFSKGGLGGFDAVIGNPPYVRIQGMKEWAPIEVEHYKKSYKAASKGNYDIYVVFVEKGVSLLNDRGVLGFILPHKFFNSQYGKPLRGLIAEKKLLREIIHFGDQQVFADATTYTCLLFLRKEGGNRFHFVKVHDLPTWQRGEPQIEGDISADKVKTDEWNFVVGPGAKLFERLGEMPVKLRDVASIFVGLQTSADKVYVMEKIKPSKHGLVTVKDSNGVEWRLEHQILKPFLYHVTVSTFKRPISTHFLIFPYHLADNAATLISASEMSYSYPQVWKYLKENARILRKRESGKADNDQWYGYIYRKNLTLFDAPKLIVQVISMFGRYAYENIGLYFTGGGNGPYYGIRWFAANNPHSLHYLQALLESRLLDFYLRRISSPFRGGYWSYGKRFIEQLPIRTINFSDSNDKGHHDQMVGLVEQMLDLNKQLAEAKAPQAKTVLQRQIETTDKQIDELVYELYGLTEEEIRIVEQSAK